MQGSDPISREQGAACGEQGKKDRTELLVYNKRNKVNDAV